VELMSKQGLVDDAVKTLLSPQSYLLRSVRGIRMRNEIRELKRPTPEDLDRIFTPGTWTKLKCEECKQDVDRLVAFADIETDDYGHTVDGSMICAPCLHRAIEMLALDAKDAMGEAPDKELPHDQDCGTDGPVRR
jgi:hypothetical protein